MDPETTSKVVEVLYLVGTTVGAPSHVAPLVGGLIGGATACGVATVGMVVSVKAFWPGNITCDECRKAKLDADTEGWGEYKAYYKDQEAAYYEQYDDDNREYTED